MKVACSTISRPHQFRLRRESARWKALVGISISNAFFAVRSFAHFEREKNVAYKNHYVHPTLFSRQNRASCELLRDQWGIETPTRLTTTMDWSKIGHSSYRDPYQAYRSSAQITPHVPGLRLDVNVFVIHTHESQLRTDRYRVLSGFYTDSD